MTETLEFFIQRSLFQRFAQKTVCDHKGDLFKVIVVSISDDDGLEAWLYDRYPNQIGYPPPWEPRSRSFRLGDALPEIVNMQWNESEKRWMSKEPAK